MPKNSVPFQTLLKASLIVSLIPLVVLAVLVVTGQLTLTAFVLAYLVNLFGATLLVYPFMGGVLSLSGYIHGLSQDKRMLLPDLTFLGMAGELSDGLGRLQRL